MLHEPSRLTGLDDPASAGERSRGCKWPIGDPATADFSFCGARRPAGRPYCAEHLELAYRPTTRAQSRNGLRDVRRAPAAAPSEGEQRPLAVPSTVS